MTRRWAERHSSAWYTHMSTAEEGDFFLCTQRGGQEFQVT